MAMRIEVQMALGCLYVGGLLAWEWVCRRLWGRPRPPEPKGGCFTVDGDALEMQTVHGRELVEIRYRIGCHWYVWRYRPEQVAEALRLPGVMAALGGEFTFDDASRVTQAMRAERTLREAQGSAAGV